MQAIILAAGRGTRMQSETHKVLHLLGGRPMIAHILDTLTSLGIPNPTVVVGQQKEAVMAAVQVAQPGATFATQDEPLGTSDAVKAALSELTSNEPAFILVGDQPFYTVATLSRLLEEHKKTGAVITVAVAVLDDPKTYGRIIRNSDGKMTAITEFKQASPSEQQIQEVNMGAYVVDPTWLKQAITQVQPQPTNGEYYFTDLVALAHAQDRTTATIQIENPAESIGIDTPEMLAKGEEILASQNL